jgi:hypothetical protein
MENCSKSKCFASCRFVLFVSFHHTGVQFDEKMTISVWVKLHTIGRSYEMYGGPHGAEQVSQKEENTPIKLSTTHSSPDKTINYSLFSR